MYGEEGLRGMRNDLGAFVSLVSLLHPGIPLPDLSRARHFSLADTSAPHLSRDSPCRRTIACFPDTELRQFHLLRWGIRLRLCLPLYTPIAYQVLKPIPYLIFAWVLYRSLSYVQITTTCIVDKSQEAESITQYSTVLHSCSVMLTCLSDYALIAY